MTRAASASELAPMEVGLHGMRAIQLKAVFVDANPTLAGVAERLLRLEDVAFTINRAPDIVADELPAALSGAQIAIVDHTNLPTHIARQCAGLRDVVFLGTGARSYMNPDELAELGIVVHTIKGYGDTAVAECAIALMWAAARDLSAMDRGIRAGQWLRTDALQLTGRTIGLVGFGGIAARGCASCVRLGHACSRVEPRGERACGRNVRPDRDAACGKRRRVDPSGAQR